MDLRNRRLSIWLLAFGLAWLFGSLVTTFAMDDEPTLSALLIGATFVAGGILTADMRGPRDPFDTRP